MMILKDVVGAILIVGGCVAIFYAMWGLARSELRYRKKKSEWEKKNGD